VVLLLFRATNNTNTPREDREVTMRTDCNDWISSACRRRQRAGGTARANREPAYIFAATHIASMTVTDSESGTASATVRVKITR
jgi:hypothetical protein